MVQSRNHQKSKNLTYRVKAESCFCIKVALQRGELGAGVVELVKAGELEVAAGGEGIPVTRVSNRYAEVQV